MGRLYAKIRKAILDGRYSVGTHAGNQLDERNIPDWQVIASFSEGTLLLERPSAKPNAAIELQQLLPDGTRIKTVWSWLPVNRAAKLVTVHYFDR